MDNITSARQFWTNSSEQGCDCSEQRMSVLSKLILDAKGVALLKDWLGEGGNPVEKDLSEQRAGICDTCPHNKYPNWWEKVKESVAGVIRRQLEIKSEAGLSVDCENRLHLCENCGCCLKLKVHVPLHHIMAHTDENTFNLFPPFCWIVKEIAPASKPP